MEEKRKYERRSLMESIQYSVTVLDFRELKRLDLTGDIIDISDKGMGIHTDFPLERGHVLKFNGGTGHKAGIVKWSIVVNNRRYRVGIKFV